MTVRILIGDCRERMAELDAGSIDSCVTDPPYHLTSIVKRFGAVNAAPAKVGKTGAYARASRGFMGQQWDGGDVAFDPATWESVLRVLKPGAHLVAFSGTRTYHRMVCAIEDAGFEIRDQLAWIYGSGFPKSHDVAKQIDKAAGHWRGRAGEITIASQVAKGTEYERAPKGDAITAAAREWQGWGTALKPAWEPICLARKPLIGTVAATVLAHGTGAINIDGCRIETSPEDAARIEAMGGFGRGDYVRPRTEGTFMQGTPQAVPAKAHDLGRWPANIIHDGSDEVLAGFPETSSPCDYKRNTRPECGYHGNFYGQDAGNGFGDSGSAARFFYCAKATTSERGEGNNHPTVKPVDLMRWLCRLVTPAGGTVLDPFAGSGSTLIAADAEQFNAIGCELSPAYAAIAEQRVRDAAGMFAEVQAA